MFSGNELRWKVNCWVCKSSPPCLYARFRSIRCGTRRDQRYQMSTRTCVDMRVRSLVCRSSEASGDESISSRFTCARNFIRHPDWYWTSTCSSYCCLLMKKSMFSSRSFINSNHWINETTNYHHYPPRTIRMNNRSLLPSPASGYRFPCWSKDNLELPLRGHASLFVRLFERVGMK